MTVFVPRLALVLGLVGCGGAAPPPAATAVALPATEVVAPAAPGAGGAEVEPAVDERGDEALVQIQTPALQDAVSAYLAGRMAEAGVALQQVVEGAEPASPEEIQLAQLFLAKALFHLGLYHSALMVIDEIVQQSGHVARLRAAPWLAMLGSRLGDPTRVDRIVRHYSVDEIAEACAGQHPDFEATLRYRLGRQLYEEASFPEAVAVLSSVPGSSRHRAAARYFVGVAHVRVRDDPEALTAFRALIHELDSPAPGTGEPQRMRDMAWLAVARLHFSAAGDHDDPHALGQALAAYAHVHADSDQSDVARFEEAWALLRLRRQTDALASLDRLAPTFVEQTPEAEMLRAVIAYTRCDADRTFALTQRFQDDHRGQPAQLTAFADAHDAEAMVDLIDHGVGEAPAVVRGVLDHAVMTGLVRRRIDELDKLDEEGRVLERAEGTLRDSSLGARVVQDLAISRALTRDELGELLGNELRRQADALVDLLVQAATLQAEADAVRSGRRPCTP